MGHPVYRDIDSTKSVSNFELSRERQFAFENGGKYLVDVGDTVDFHWLVNVRLNGLKFRFCGDLNVGYYPILNVYKSALSNDLYWSIFQHHLILNHVESNLYGDKFNKKRDSYVLYLQLLANAYFDFVKKNLSSQNTARDILLQENEMWVENVGNVECRNTEYKLISSTVLSRLKYFYTSVCSPDKKLLVLAEYYSATVIELPSLTMIFKIQVSQMLFTPTFSPDSSYFLCGSIRSCVCIRKQKKVAFIPGGPEDIEHCSFSSCGKKLVTVEENFLKVWDVEKRELLVQVEKHYERFDCYYFSSCNNYILESNGSKLVVRDSTTLEEFLTLREDCSEKCPDSYQISYLVNKNLAYTRYYHLSADEVVVIAHADSFTWKNRKCQILSYASTLFIYDFINRERVDRFQIDCLPVDTKIDCISKLDGTNFLLSLDFCAIVVLSLETSEESSVVSYVFPHDTSFEVTLSPDHLYVACRYDEYNVLTIRSVVNGETLETVKLQKPPEACWWSELYLWMVCEGALVGFPYYSGHSKVLGSGREVCPLTFFGVLGFGEGVFVFTGNDNMITILKICDNMPFIQKISNPLFGEVAISKDGCAVLFFDEQTEDATIHLPYQLWEFTPESGWELHLDGEIGKKLCELSMDWLSLTGTQSCRRLMYVLKDRGTAILSFFDFTSRELYEYSLHLPNPYAVIKEVVDVAPNVLLIDTGKWWSVLNVSDHKVVATLSFRDIFLVLRPHLFYLSSKGLLLHQIL